MFILNQFFQANVHLSCNITIDVPVLQFHVVFPTQCNVFLVRYLKNPSLFHHTEAMSKLKKKKVTLKSIIGIFLCAKKEQLVNIERFVS